MKQTPAQRDALEAIRKGRLGRASLVRAIVCDHCAILVEMTMIEARKAGWRKRWRQLAVDGIRVQVDVCPGCRSIRCPYPINRRASP